MSTQTTQPSSSSLTSNIVTGCTTIGLGLAGMALFQENAPVIANFAQDTRLAVANFAENIGLDAGYLSRTTDRFSQRFATVTGLLSLVPAIPAVCNWWENKRAPQ